MRALAWASWLAIAGTIVAVPVITPAGSDASEDAHQRRRAFVNACTAVHAGSAPAKAFADLAKIVETNDCRQMFRRLDQRAVLALPLVYDLGPIAHLAALRRLDLTIDGEVDLSPLAAMRQLRTLRVQAGIDGASIKSLRFLRSMDGLRYLVLERVLIGDASGLGIARGLQWLTLREAGLRDLAFASHLPDLKRLDVTANAIEDLAPLARLPQLKHLRVASNRLRSVQPLSAVTSLEDLDLSGNPLDDASPLAALRTIRTLRLEPNPGAASPLTQIGRCPTGSEAPSPLAEACREIIRWKHL